MLFDYTSAMSRSVVAAVEAVIARGEGLIEEILSVRGSRTFANTLRPFEEVARLGALAYGRGPFLGQVAADETVRTAAREGEERLEKWALDLISRRDLYRAIRDYAGTDDAAALAGEPARALDHALRDFRMAGHELSEEGRSRVRELLTRLVSCQVAFSAALAEYEDHLDVSEADLEGMPHSYVARLAPGESEGSYRITMAYPDVIPFMENSPRRDLRQALALKFGNRAREENTPLLEEALAIRARLAATFGARSWAHHSMVKKMARRPEAVTSFYGSILDRLTEAGLRERAAMERLLEARDDVLPVQPWDRAYCHTEQMKQEYGVDRLEVAAYFPLDQVVAGMFEITQRVFGLTYQQVDAPVWHEEVLAYRITDTASGELVAHFYMDLHPRDGKFGHAAAFPLAPGGMDIEGGCHRPVSAMVANLTRPTPDTPSLLLHDEVVTLFHEFGHILHMSLSRAELARFSGSRTEWDFVEAPSQIMENWCWIPDVLGTFARHHATGEPIPPELVTRLTDARNLNVALFNLRQVMLGQIDLELHTTLDPVDLEGVLRSRAQTGLLPHHEGTFMLSSFGHLLGGYDAGYYGYLWAEVFGQDMFSRFAEEGVLSTEVGMAYRRKVLEPGGTKDAIDLLQDFLGREPRSDAFLRKLGLEG
ncbi:M3 family metallopeptidase [Candidatus Spongiisocius sp.]|uniref:M3 family metallopeptidase n=1 Tax=Candidatus Spongiisocius sp. TaxID=3101273 RepID=UPI003B5CB90C